MQFFCLIIKQFNDIIYIGDVMERTLSLVLDQEYHITLTLLKDEADKIDKFTTKNFENSEQIRELYSDKIDSFLRENSAYVNAVVNSTGKKYRGRIVILEVEDAKGNINYIEKKVLYKKHLAAFETLVNDSLTMIRFSKMERMGYNIYNYRPLVSKFVIDKIKHTNFKVKSQVNIIKREIKKNNFFDSLRIMVKAYEEERKERPDLISIDNIYENIKKSKEKIEDDLEIKEDIEQDEYYIVDGVRYSLDDRPFDSDELRHLETNLKEDGINEKPDKRIL